jgi:hypothetical protein
MMLIFIKCFSLYTEVSRSNYLMIALFNDSGFYLSFLLWDITRLSQSCESQPAHSHWYTGVISHITSVVITSNPTIVISNWISDIILNSSSVRCHGIVLTGPLHSKLIFLRCWLQRIWFFMGPLPGRGYSAFICCRIYGCYRSVG